MPPKIMSRDTVSFIKKGTIFVLGFLFDHEEMRYPMKALLMFDLKVVSDDLLLRYSQDTVGEHLKRLHDTLVAGKRAKSIDVKLFTYQSDKQDPCQDLVAQPRFYAPRIKRSEP
jgi:hypothetical protein